MTVEPQATPPASDEAGGLEAHHGFSLALVMGSLGVVFGDIGTSPLYTFQECMHHHQLAVDAPNVLGVVSLIFWSLTLIVTLKYVAVLMQADNKGEGGIMALAALVPAELRSATGGRVAGLSLLVIAGAALLFGDGVITPAISVLSAMEGLVVANAGLQPYVVPLTCLILVALFSVQSKGTGAMGTLFGPVMLVWFLTIGGLGLANIIRTPAVCAALSPAYAASFLWHHGFPGFPILGSVVLAVTGGEALYADMGHFGRTPIRIAWLAVTYPSLVLCYFGQGALVLAHPEAVSSPFFSMLPPGFWTYLLVLLAAAATVIASQGLISAVFSLTHQAVRLAYLPRVIIRHTSAELEGRIYVPAVNWVLASACVALVLSFQHSSKLAGAYGLAVSGTMGITSVVLYYVTRATWGWPAWRSRALLLFFLLLDLPFFAATCLKFFDGGYLPVALGAVLFVIMTTYLAGRTLLAEYLRANTQPIRSFIDALDSSAPQRLPGLGIVMAATEQGTPPALSLMVRRFRSVHQFVFLLTLTTEGAPHVPDTRRLELESLGRGFYRVVARFGFMDDPAVPAVVAAAIRLAALDVAPAQAVYLLSRETFLATDRGRMSAIREAFFAFLSRNATNPSLYFDLPPEQVVELGSRIDL